MPYVQVFSYRGLQGARSWYESLRRRTQFAARFGALEVDFLASSVAGRAFGESAREEPGGSWRGAVLLPLRDEFYGPPGASAALDPGEDEGWNSHYTEMLLAHEVAHVACPPWTAHGPLWASTYVEVLHCAGRHELADCLWQSFRAHGVRTDPW